MSQYTQSKALFDRAQKSIPGGVNSPVRAFRAVDGTPVFITRASGSKMYDADGNSYIDYVGSWGPMILGHAHPEVINRVTEVAQQGLSFGAPTELEIEMADKVCSLMPSIEQIRMVSSGTEATMSAIRLARGHTNRHKIIKFEGCYHGHSDSLLIKAGSGALTLGVPTSPGVPPELAQHTITLPYNDFDAVKEAFTTLGDQVACVIIEPVAGNMNCIPPVEGFLELIREQCDQYGSLLIFDEVMTGFRVALGGAQSLFNIKPDLTTLGKIIGGGMPVGAFGGRKDIMNSISPLGPVYQAGTLSGNPVAMAAGLTTLELISKPNFHQTLTEKTTRVVNGIVERSLKHGIPMSSNQAGGMFGFFFTDREKVTRFSEAMACDQAQFKHFFHGMLNRGIYFAPASYEAGFVSAAHSEDDIKTTLDAADDVLALLPNK